MIQSGILKQWPWNDSIRYCLWISVIIITGITVYSAWYFSDYWFFLLFFSLLLLNYIIRAKKINKMITTLKGCISAQNGETIEGMVSIKGQLSPGIIIMRDDLFILIPVVGRRTKIYFNKITAIKEHRLNPLKYLFSKHGFVVEVDKVKTVSFWVMDSVAKRWSLILNDRFLNHRES